MQSRRPWGGHRSRNNPLEKGTGARLPAARVGVTIFCGKGKLFGDNGLGL